MNAWTVYFYWVELKKKKNSQHKRWAREKKYVGQIGTRFKDRLWTFSNSNEKWKNYNGLRCCTVGYPDSKDLLASWLVTKCPLQREQESEESWSEVRNTIPASWWINRKLNCHRFFFFNIERGNSNLQAGGS